MNLRRYLLFPSLMLLLLLSACSASPTNTSPAIDQPPERTAEVDTTDESPEPAEPTPPDRREVKVPLIADASFADKETIFHNGNLLTMEAEFPRAKAILIKGESIVAMGSDEEILALRGPETQVIDLGGRTMSPGFIDNHSHRIFNRDKWGFSTPEQAVQAAVQEGWTTLDLLAESPENLDELLDLVERGGLSIRLNAYLAHNGFGGEPYGPWYQAYEPFEQISPLLRIAGIKIFIDFDSGRVFFFEQGPLNELVYELQMDGWQVSVKAISIQSHELALNAYDFALDGESNDLHRHRIEHSVAVSDDQLERMASLGIVACIQPGLPGVMSYDADIHRMAEEHGKENVFRWQEYQDGGVIMIASPLNPPGVFEEQTHPDHMSPMGVLYRGITQIGPDGASPEPWMLEKTLTVEDLLPLLTINGAYATFEEDHKGSLAPGKWADLVILSGDPLAVETDDLLGIEVLMTMVGGQVAWCAPGADPLCPSFSGGEEAGEDPFIGEWFAIDPADGSSMTLQISRSDGAYDVLLIDEGATACGLDDTGTPTTAAEIPGTGSVQGDVLTIIVTTLTCLTEPPTTMDLNLSMDYVYQHDTDALYDSVQDTVWRRK